MRKQTITLFTVAVLTLALIATAQAGWFSSEPPSEWDKLPIVYRRQDSHIFAAYFLRTKKGKSRPMTYGEFMARTLESGKNDTSWREGKKDGRWIVDIDHTDENNNRRRKFTVVFQQDTSRKGMKVVWLKKVYVDDKPMPPAFCQWFLEIAYKSQLAYMQGQAGKR